MQTFYGLLDAYHSAGDDAGRSVAERRLWDEYGIEGAAYVLDMSGFSLLVQRHGVVHYLAMVRRMHVVVRPIIERHDGRVVKFEADNCFARFAEVEPAIRAAIAINQAMATENLGRHDDRAIRVSSGIDFGRFLLVREADFFGSPVNLASKLGEDIAEPGEILVTAAAMGRVGRDAAINSEPVTVTVSGIELAFRRIFY